MNELKNEIELFVLINNLIFLGCWLPSFISLFIIGY